MLHNTPVEHYVKMDPFFFHTLLDRMLPGSQEKSPVLHTHTSIHTNKPSTRGSLACLSSRGNPECLCQCRMPRMWLVISFSLPSLLRCFLSIVSMLFLDCLMLIRPSVQAARPTTLHTNPYRPVSVTSSQVSTQYGPVSRSCFRWEASHR